MQKRLSSLKEKGILPADCLWTHTASLPWISSLLAWPEDFGFGSLYNHMSQFLKISLYISISVSINLSVSIYPSIYIYTHMHTHAHPIVLFLWRNLTNNILHNRQTLNHISESYFKFNLYSPSDLTCSNRTPEVSTIDFLSNFP